MNSSNDLYNAEELDVFVTVADDWHPSRITEDDWFDIFDRVEALHEFPVPESMVCPSALQVIKHVKKHRKDNPR